MFCDELTLKFIAGRGGNGSVSFRREKFVPKGGPDGGNGGRGGNIILKVNPQLTTLSHLTSQKTYKAYEGVAGRGKNMHGKNAEDLILEVPQGTIVYNDETKQQIVDLSEPEDLVKIAKGGKGGLGNANFVSSIHQIPRFAETGEPGEEITVKLELKLVADVGIIGLPSAGKSTLISVVSKAKPKIAEYHFTTLIPNLGVVYMDQFGGSNQDSFVIADIPGLIEGASEGKGLGHEFLRHVSRTKILIHVMDGSLDQIAENYTSINNELKKFDKKLSKKTQIPVINKIDILSDEQLESQLKELKTVTSRKKIFTISAAAHKNLKDLMQYLSKKVKEEKIKEAEELLKKKEKASKDIPVLKPHLDKVPFTINKTINKKTHKIYRVSGKRVDQLVVMTDISNQEGLQRLYHYFDKMSLIKALKKKGAKSGDTIRIKDKNIPFRG